jgi:hypothetical protein
MVVTRRSSGDTSFMMAVAETSSRSLPDVVRCAQRLLTYFAWIPIRVALVLSKNACRVRVATLTGLVGWPAG